MCKEIKNYFDSISLKVNKAYEIAEKARKLNLDPIDKVEIPLAKNMAERVEGLVSAVVQQIKGSGIVERIFELEKEYGNQDWRIAFVIALEVAKEKFCKFENKKEAMETGIRVGIAYLTNGVVSSPLEGFTRLELKKRKDGKDYFCIYYAGPIRSAGGTAAAVSVLLADYVRKHMGYDVYDPTNDEIRRVITELYDYNERITNLQYLPSEKEIEFLVKNIPVQIDGEQSEQVEVSNYKDLERIETNRIRNGVCLVLGEGIAQKATKIYGKFSKWMNEFGMDNWKFLEEFLELQKKIKANIKKAEVTDKSKLVPDYTYIKDLVAGRPIITYPLEFGGLRLRYGRARNSGFSASALHPATMIVLKNYIAIGTQLKTERPAKASVVGICDRIEGPIVKLKDGSVIYLDSKEKAIGCLNEIKEILFLGDILISYGDFYDRAHKLVPCGYNEEWYTLELEKVKSEDKIIKDLIKSPYSYISAKDAIFISEKFNIPLHPKYTYHWDNINKEQFIDLLEWFKTAAIYEDKIILPFIHSSNGAKRVLELLGVPHKVSDDYVFIRDDDAVILKRILKLPIKNGFNLIGDNVIDIVNNISGIVIRDKSGTFIGARMGRPEKAKMRKLKGNPHILFPVGSEGGRMRSFNEALIKGKVTAEFPFYYCENCKKETIYRVCESCNNLLTKNKISVRKQTIDISYYWDNCLKKLNIKEYKNLVKGVKGVSNKESTPEYLLKGILRSKHSIYVNKDGTVRYDMTEMPITHFKSKEIGVSINKLKELGYDKDIYDNELVNSEQILELKVQDVILPACDQNNEEGADEVLFKVANFIDDCLKYIYGLKPYYKLKNKDDLIGHLCIAISPHTSAGNVCRIIGFSKTQGFLAHPLMHSMMRRDCDGDESAVILLMDCLLNFSRKFLPQHRGTTQDAPLVLTSILIPSEVDDMVYNMDVCWKYPLELYEAALNYKDPKEVKIEQYGSRLNKDEQYYGLGFTHDVLDFNDGVRCSAYKYIPTMMDKVRGQMDLAEKIRAVDAPNVATLIIERHFMRDLKGNLRKFSMQKFRCVDCNESYRRPPLVGKCLKCNGNIMFTVSEGSIVKYLEPSLELAEKYSLPNYLKQSLELTKQRIESIFGKDKEKQEGLTKWF